MRIEYQEDCIHLKACRRLSKRLRAKGITIGRGCNESCTAYETLEEAIKNSDEVYYTYAEVEEVKYGACMDGQRGYYPGDLLVSDYV